MSDPANLEVPILHETLTNECPLQGCDGKLELTHFQNQPVVDCPKLSHSEVFMPGMEVPEGLEDCPLIKRIREEDEVGVSDG